MSHRTICNSPDIYLCIYCRGCQALSVDIQIVIPLFNNEGEGIFIIVTNGQMAWPTHFLNRLAILVPMLYNSVVSWANIDRQENNICHYCKLWDIITHPTIPLVALVGITIVHKIVFSNDSNSNFIIMNPTFIKVQPVTCSATSRQRRTSCYCSREELWFKETVSNGLY